MTIRGILNIGFTIFAFHTATGIAAENNDHPTTAPSRTQVVRPPSSPFIGVVYQYADALIENCRDTYGPVKTGLFLSALDRVTLKPLTTRPASPEGIRREDRSGAAWQPLIGANPHLDENLIRVLYVLYGLSNNKKYKEAADNELKWFLENAESPVTHLLPWGEHMFWDVMEDKPRTGMADGHGVHEFARPWVLWDQCYELAPEASEKFAIGLWEHQIGNHKDGAFDRHAGYEKHEPGTGNDFARHAGFYIRTWAVAYAHTKNEKFLNAIDVLLTRYEQKRDPTNGLIEFKRGAPTAAPLLSLSLAIDCEGAAGQVPDPLSSRLQAFAAREDEVFCGLPHDLKGKCGFVDTLDKKTGKLPEGKDSLTPVWSARYGGPTTAAVGMMCVARYDNVGKVCYRDMIHAAADCYLNSMPGEDEDVWPMTAGHAISLEIAAWRSTANRKYFDRAREVGLWAVAKFFQGNALPKASLKLGHYESLTGADTLALALVQLHLDTLHITAVRCPANTIDR